MLMRALVLFRSVIERQIAHFSDYGRTVGLEVAPKTVNGAFCSDLACCFNGCLSVLCCLWSLWGGWK